jgi:hypothetical protein
MSKPRCPTPERCEVSECSGRCKPRAVALTPPPIPLHLRHLSAAERGMGIVKLTETLQRWLRPRPAPAAPSAPFLPLLEESPMSEFLAPAHDLPVTITPEPPAKPAPVPPGAPVKPGASPTAALQVVPVKFGGFVLVGERGPIAVAVDGPGLAKVMQRWAAGDLV